MNNTAPRPPVADPFGPSTGAQADAATVQTMRARIATLEASGGGTGGNSADYDALMKRLNAAQAEAEFWRGRSEFWRVTVAHMNEHAKDITLQTNGESRPNQYWAERARGFAKAIGNLTGDAQNAALRASVQETIGKFA